MKKFYFASRWLVLAILAVVTISCGKSNTATESAEKRVVILSMDGFRWDYTLHANTPTLDSIRKVGTYSQVMPVFPANTFPNHYSMATGMHPNSHGVVNNNFYDKTLDRQMSVFTAADCLTDDFWGGEPIWNTLERQGGVANIMMWPGSEYPINGRHATSWMKYDHDMDYYERADRVVAAMSQPEAKRPNLVMWYMPDPDAVGHHNGPNSPECIAKVEYIDKVLSYFMAKMRETPDFENTNFIFTADHGMTELSEDRYVNMYGAIDKKKVKYYISGAPFTIEVEEDYLDEAVERLNKLEHLTAYRADAMPERYHYGSHPTRIANIVIIPEMGWKLDYRYKPYPPKNNTGSHGYDPFESDMQMVFYGVGPNFKVGYTQPTFQDLNVHLILAHLLGVEPAEESECDWNAVKGMFVE